MSLAYLLARIAAVEARVRNAVAKRRADDPQPDDPFRGLYLSDDAVDRLLAAQRGPLAIADSVPVQTDSRLHRLGVAFGLTALDTEILLVALAPDVDARFEWFYGYLNDDVTRRRATVGLALSMCGVPAAAAAGRARFGADAPLCGGGLVTVGDPERPLLARPLRVPDRVVAHLLGDDTAAADLADVCAPPPPRLQCPQPHIAAAVHGPETRLVYLRERPGGGGVAAAFEAAPRALLVELGRLAQHPDLVGALVLEARLTGAVLVGSGVDALADHPAVLAVLADAPTTVVLVGTPAWDPAWARRQPVVFDVAAPGLPERSRLWRAVLPDQVAHGLDPALATMQFVLTPEQIRRAAESARMHAELGSGTVGAEELRRGARAQNSAGLEKLARRIEPAVGWADLVLPAPVLEQLTEVALRARHRAQVLDEWRMRPGGGRGRGVTALFAGDSGTGKTMSAEVIAADLGLDLYTVNLATVVDKYVGETEKNLERIFTAAAGVNAVLLFDEADALFGRRSEVRDAHDRYANIESAYLLQRLETFDGLAILATNLRANLDEAFTRRLDVVINYPLPDEDSRRKLWRHGIGARIPQEPDLDIDFCARAFELSGGNIRSAVVTAAYLAAAAARPLRTEDLVAGVHREYRKLGRLTVAAEFGEYHAALAQPATT